MSLAQLNFRQVINLRIFLYIISRLDVVEGGLKVLRGLYSAVTGMNVQQAKIENITNNMANVSTPGYKKEELLIQSFPEHLLIEQGGQGRKDGLPLQTPTAVIGSMGGGSLIAGISTDHTNGTFQETGNSTDFAIKGPGYFVVSAPTQSEPDKTCYTRSGLFKVDQEGYLTLEGRYRVLGEAGELKVGNDKFNVSPDGSVNVEGQIVDKLRLVEFDDLNNLSKEGEGLYTGIQGSEKQAVATTVFQGKLEMSNVNAIDEMAQLISVMRAYEANQKIIQNYDEILSKAVNQVGSIK